MKYGLVDLAFNPAEPRDAHGRWTAAEVSTLRDWLSASDMVKDQDAFESALSKMQPYTGTTYRGVARYTSGHKRFATLETGDIVHWQHHKSASTNRAETERNFGADTYIIKGATGRRLDYYDLEDAGIVGTDSAEREVVMPPGDYEVTGLGMSGRKNTLSVTLTYRGPLTNTVDWVTRKAAREVALSNIDLAAPRPKALHRIPPRVDTDETVTAIARILTSSARFKRTSGDFGAEVEGLEHLLQPFGVKRTAVRMALGLTHKEGGGRYGTAHSPNAVLQHHGAKLVGKVREVRDAEVYFRAAYLANAAHRLQAAMNNGASQRDALRQERAYYRLHEQARKGRLMAAAQVQHAANMFGQRDENGTLVGWYLNPLLHNEVECKVANGNNFYAEQGTVIGLPGSVHNRCGCYAGAPHPGAGMVNDAVRNIAVFTRSRPKFKVKGRKTA